MARAQHSTTLRLTTQELIESARTSIDGIVIREAINRIEESPLTSEEKNEAIVMLATIHGDKPIVVTRCLSGLARTEAPQLRALCRTLINAPFDPDKEDVVAYATTLLAPMPNPERVDMLLLAKAVDHRSLQIRNAARIAIEQLPKQCAAALLTLAKEIPEKPPISLLKRHITGIDWRVALIPPPRPPRSEAKVSTSPKLRPQKETGGRGVSSGREPERKAPFPSLSERRDAEAAASPSTPTSPRGHIPDLHAHRLPEFALASDSLLANEIVMSQDYRRIAAALAELTVRNGAKSAHQFNSRLIYALTDPGNNEKARFEDIALWVYPEANESR